MKIQFVSDLHNEFLNYTLTDAGADVVVLAGDIHVQNNALDWIDKNIPSKPVIYILGNHEFYGATYPDHIESMKKEVSGTHIHILERDSLALDGVVFLGCTLWTNFELFGHGAESMYLGQQVMNDYQYIRHSKTGQKLCAMDTAVVHDESVQWLQQQLKIFKDRQTVIVTHHAPSLKSVPAERQHHFASPSYASNLDGLIDKHSPNIWIHGHLHSSSDYHVGTCHVVSNPKGYPHELNPDFDPHRCISL